jgi:ribosome-associated protein
MAEHDDPTAEPGSEWGRPSRSARKREAEAAQKLGVRLTGLRAGQLAELELPEELRAAIAEAKRLTSRSALGRQNQYIGRLMRDIDPEPILRILDAAKVRPGPHAKLP